MATPEFMPVLSAGGHDNPKDGACLMEMVSYLAGEKWSAAPVCTDPWLASMARNTNDMVTHEERQRLLPLIPSLIGARVPVGDDHQAVWDQVTESLKMRNPTSYCCTSCWFDAMSEGDSDGDAIDRLIEIVRLFNDAIGRPTEGTLSEEDKRVLVEVTS